MEPLEDEDPRQVGDFSLEGRLGSGGMGQVYLGRDPNGRLAAVKVIHEGLARNREFRARFAREVFAAGKVGGAHTAELLDAGPQERRPWMAIRFIEGRSLAEVVEQGDPLPAEQVMALGAGIGEALGAIHRAGIVHRDLKPSNVMLGPAGPIVIDFGIARAAETSTLTGTGIVSGSAGFMSPEQALGHAVGAATDIFSLGALLYFAATGQPAFGTGNYAALMFRVVHEECDLGAVQDERVRALVAACLAKDPAERLDTGDLVAFCEGRQPLPERRAAPPGAPTGAPGPPMNPGRSPSAVFRAETEVHGSGDGVLAGRRRALAQYGAAALALAVLAVIAGTSLFALHQHTTRLALASSNRTSSDRATPTPTATSTPPQPAVVTTPSPSVTSAGPAGSAGPVLQPGTVDALTSASAVVTASGPAKVRSPSRGASGSGSSTSSGAGAAPKTGSGTKSVKPKAQAPKSVGWNSVSISSGSNYPAREYFGMLSDVMGQLSDLHLNVSSDYATSHPDVCVETVVFSTVTGSDAAVYAQGAGSGWTGAENAPSTAVSTDDGVVHQQLIVPPAGTTAGTGWQLGAFVRVDGVDSSAGSAGLSMTSGGSSPAWAFGGKTVNCKL